MALFNLIILSPFRYSNLLSCQLLKKRLLALSVENLLGLNYSKQLDPAYRDPNVCLDTFKIHSTFHEVADSTILSKTSDFGICCNIYARPAKAYSILTASCKRPPRTHANSGFQLLYYQATSNLAIKSRKHLKISCQKYKIDSLLLSPRCMTNYMKSCSFLHAHIFE